MEVRRNEQRKRFEAELEGYTGVLEYRLQDNSIVFTHTGVPPAIEGKGVASSLAKAGLEYARGQKMKVVPLCPFVQQYLLKHSEYADLVM